MLLPLLLERPTSKSKAGSKRVLFELASSVNELFQAEDVNDWATAYFQEDATSSDSY